ncbi:MAG: ISNCY family transposase, partial [Minisyncoccales bacterium]
MTNEKAVKRKLKELDEFLLEKYRKEISFKRRNEPGYDIRFVRRLKTAIRSLRPLIQKATKEIVISRDKGAKPKLTLEQKVTLILLKQLIEKSNRMMEGLLDLFLMILGFDISYKTIERLYSDKDVWVALCNLGVLILEEKGIQKIDASGDATGYALTITKHYRSHAQKLKEKSKKSSGKKKQFAYNFALIDLNTKMYVAIGISLKSEKQAYNNALKMFNKTRIELKSIRLDRYYSNPSDVNRFNKSIIYFIPKKNVTMQHGLYWNSR